MSLTIIKAQRNSHKNNAMFSVRLLCASCSIYIIVIIAYYAVLCLIIIAVSFSHAIIKVFVYPALPDNYIYEQL